MTLAIIWAVANILQLNYRWWRLILAAVTGTIYFMVAIITQYMNYIPLINIIAHISLNIITALIMVKVAFKGLCKGKYMKAVIYLYLITFITIGTTLSIFYISGGSPFRAGMQRLLTGIFVLFVLGNLGWRLFQQYTTPEEYYLPVRVFCGKKELNFTGLIDTGNSLTDPLTGAPVIVINKEEVVSLISEDIQKELLDNEDPLQIMDIFSKSEIGHRIRVLPFSDLGQEHGLLIGVRPDLIELKYRDRTIKIQRGILALSKHRLDEDNHYQALIHPGLININI